MGCFFEKGTQHEHKLATNLNKSMGRWLSDNGGKAEVNIEINCGIGITLQGTEVVPSLIVFIMRVNIVNQNRIFLYILITVICY